MHGHRNTLYESVRTQGDAEQRTLSICPRMVLLLPHTTPHRTLPQRMCSQLCLFRRLIAIILPRSALRSCACMHAPTHLQYMTLTTHDYPTGSLLVPPARTTHGTASFAWHGKKKKRDFGLPRGGEYVYVTIWSRDRWRWNREYGA